LVADDLNGVADIFLYRVADGQIELVTFGWEGGQANGSSGNPDISADGTWITFSSQADNLVPYDTNEVGDVFVFDISSGLALRVSVNALGEEGNDHSISPVISGDGGTIALVSLASNLVPDDSNEKWDVFVYALDSVWDSP